MGSRRTRDPDEIKREQQALEVARIWKTLDDRSRCIIYGELISYDQEVKKALEIVKGLPRAKPTVQKEGRVLYVDRWTGKGGGFL